MTRPSSRSGSEAGRGGGDRWRRAPRLVGKTVYVSGGSSGIGLACARLAATRGANVVIFARDRERLAAAAADLRAVASPEARIATLALDVSDHEACERLLGEACRLHGAPDIVINSAGVGGAEYFERERAEAFERRVRVNLFGVRNVISTLLPAMKARGGDIVNIASMAGLIGIFGFTSYGASKAAVIAFSEALRAELRFDGIHVCVFCPSDVDTPMLVAAARDKPIETRAISGGGGVMSSERAARWLFAGLGRRRFLIIPGVKNRLIHLLRRLAPRLVEAILHRAAERARRTP